MHRILAAIMILVWVAMTPAYSQDAVIKKILDPIRRKHKLPALGAAVVTSKGVKSIAVVGVRKHGDKTLATINDQFHIGSDTKAITSMAIAKVIESGKLKWTASVSSVFPDIAKSMHEECKGITLEHLLTHHSGLPANLKGGWWSVSRKVDIRKQRLEVVKKALAEKPSSKPGEKFIYSNLGYVIAAAMAETAAGDSWENLVQKHVFAPLKMKTAGFGPMGKAGGLDQPRQHKEGGEPVEPGLFADNPPVMGPAGRVHCSLPDWSKFVAEVLRGARGEKGLLKRETYKRLFEAPFTGRYCRGGWLTGKDPVGGRFFAHDGSNTYNYAAAFLVPSSDFAVLAVTNQGTVDGPGQFGCHQARNAILQSRLAKKQ